MNDFTTNLTLDLNCNKNTPTINSAQFDKGRIFSVAIKANGEPFTVTGCEATLKCVHSDRSCSSIDCTEGINGSTVTITLREDTLPVRGITAAKLVFTDGTRIYSTQIFLIDVDSCLDGNITATEAYSVINKLIEQIHTLSEQGLIIIDNELRSDSTNPVENRVVKAALDSKADKSTTYTKEQTVAKLNNKVDNSTFFQYQSTVYSKQEVDASLNSKAAKATTLSGYGITDAFTQAETDGEIYDIIDSILSGGSNAPTLSIDNDNEQTHYILYYIDSDDTRHDLFDFSQYFAEKATTLAGYGITDAYTQTQIDSFISNLKSRIAATNVGRDIAQESIGLSKLNFVTLGDNLFDKDGKHTPNSYISNTGEITSNNTYYLSEYIKVDPNTRYYVHGYSGADNYTKIKCVAEFKDDLTFIQRTENASYIDTNSETAYVRIAFPSANAYMTYFGEATYSGQKFDAKISGSVIDLSSNPRSGAFVTLGEPTDFSWKDSPVHGKIYTDRYGTYQVDYDVAINKNSIGTVLYVSPTGSDNNAGTKDAPLANIYTAINNGANTIYLLSGVYKRSQTLYGKIITNDLNIIGVGDNVIISPTISSNITFNLCEGSTTVWKGAAFASNVVDIKNKTVDGYYTKYMQISAGASENEVISAVNATVGSWCLYNDNIYIHTIRNVEPTNENGILILHSGQSTPTPLFNVTGGKLYLENLICIEGSSPLFAQKQNGGSNIEIYAKNCKFFYSRSTNNDVCMLQGTSMSIFQNCEASYGLKDGFNYHSHEGVIPKAVEINCIGIGNGNESDGDDQGSTIHDGGKIIRIRDICGQNYGANFADQGTDTESWNIGCVGYESKCTATDSQNANYLAYSGTKMFLDGCVGFGSKYNTNIATGTVNGKIYSRNSMECYTKAEANQRFVSSKSVAFDTNKIPLKISLSTTFANNSSNVFITDEEVRTKITTLFIASNVTQIGSEAFASCTALTDVYIDNSSDAITIASDAFCSESAPNIHYKDNYSDVFNTTDYLIKSIEQIHKTTYDKSEVNALIATAEHGGTWNDVRKIVRKGLAPIRYPIGYEFNVSKGNENIVFVVRGYDTITSADSGTTQYSMILETKKVYDTLQYDAPELAVPRFNPSENSIIFYVNSEISQGVYNFQSDGVSYYFTVPGASIPSGAIVSADIANLTVAAYHDIGASTPISGYGALTLHSGSSGAPITNQWTAIESNNNSGRVSNGSNNYAQSAIRQFLNSNAGAGSVWSPTHIFDVAPSWADNKAGFLKDMDSAFLNVVANANVICRTNNIFETGSYEADGNTYTLTDKFFILSRSELIGTTSDGTQVEYYNRINNPSEAQGQINNPSNFIKRDSEGASVAYATRSSVLNSATSIYYIKSDGTISNGSPKNTFGICPACIIA